MQTSVFLFTPPFTQLNTPYPATCYLKGFLNTKNISNFQADLGIEVTLEIFSAKDLQNIFSISNSEKINADNNLKRIFTLQNNYTKTIDTVIQFLQGKNPTLANLICTRNFLPEANRFQQINDSQYFFGDLGLQDKAKHIATLYLEDISDFIKATVDEHFGFSRYAESLARSANHFEELYAELNKPVGFVDKILMKILNEKLIKLNPILVCISIPFPGNLFSALRCGQFIKQQFPNIKIAIGGGFPNTELRDLKDKRVFEFVDFITLDDGEMPIEYIFENIQGKRKIEELKRTFTLINDKVTFINNNTCADYKQNELATPSYIDLPISNYISVIEIVNPMHKLWTDGRWNKLTMAHGCYWSKCTFCDISLPYIKDYEPITATLICNRMEEQIAETGNTGFHFVDEAAPPALMKLVALEILKRKLNVTWWTNIRFEKNFTQDLCYLLASSGCIAVSGGLEVASIRLLQLINKGITVQQVAQVTNHFSKAGIMVHAYLMFGFPTQTEQETIDSLEMVRQLFEAQIIKSGFWHKFTMTAHSPIGLQPNQFKVIAKNSSITFANNDIEHTDLTGINHDLFSFGLNKSLLNYMHNSHFDKPLQYWFEQKIPKTTIKPNYIKSCIDTKEAEIKKPNAQIIWLGSIPNIEYFTQHKNGMQREMVTLIFETQKETFKINVPKLQGEWLLNILQKLVLGTSEKMNYKELQDNYEQQNLENFELFWDNKPVNKLRDLGLLIL